LVSEFARNLILNRSHVSKDVLSRNYIDSLVQLVLKSLSAILLRAYREVNNLIIANIHII